MFSSMSSEMKDVSSIHACMLGIQASPLTEVQCIVLLFRPASKPCYSSDTTVQQYLQIA